MSPLVTILLYVVIPLAGLLLVAAATLLRPSGRGGTRYRSGGPWEFEPQWWMGNPEGSGVAEPSESHAASGSGSHAEPLILHTARGGARGTW